MNFEIAKFTIELVISLLIIPLGTLLWFLLRRMMAQIDNLQNSAQKEIEKLDKESNSRVLQIQRELAEYKLYIANKYPSQENFNELVKTMQVFQTSVFDKLDRMDTYIKDLSDNFRDRLDRKQDKQCSNNTVQ